MVSALKAKSRRNNGENSHPPLSETGPTGKGVRGMLGAYRGQKNGGERTGSNSSYLHTRVSKGLTSPPGGQPGLADCRRKQGGTASFVASVPRQVVGRFIVSAPTLGYNKASYLRECHGSCAVEPASRPVQTVVYISLKV